MIAKALVLANGGGIGDVILATPVMRALRARYPHITALVLPAHAGMLAPEAADEVWTDTTSFAGLIRRIREARFAVSVMTWANARAAYAAAFARVPVRVGAARRLYSPLLTARVLVRSERGDRTTHWSQLQLDYARALGLDGDPQPIAPHSAEGDEEARRLMAEHALTAGNFGILHPSRGLSHERPTWPVSTFAAIAQALRRHFEFPILISGSAADADIAAGAARRSGALAIAGSTGMAGFAALAARARFVVAMDSGPMHVAAAAGAPTLGIFAMRPDEPDRWAPLGPATAVLRPAYPCPRTHTKENCPDFACVRALDPDRILEALAGLPGVERETRRI